MKKIINKLTIFLFLLTIFILPNSVFAYSDKLILGGENIGIEVRSKGVLVVGFYNVGDTSPGVLAGLKVGDIITGVDDTVVQGITDLSEVAYNSSSITITYLRNNVSYTTTLNLVKDENNVLKTGLYVKDAIIGIGTLTFIDPETKAFGALGHEITEKNTGTKFEISDGKIFKSTVTSIDKSTRNSPGEKNANYYSNVVYGTISKNEINGIFGKYEGDLSNKELVEIADVNEITTGPATIHTVVNGTNVEEFEINITNIYQDSETKNILFEVADKTLLEKTNGIVQGMSGSPITQNGKIIGAVTHVVIDNPQKGYGIFINNMLKGIEEWLNHSF